MTNSDKSVTLTDKHLVGKGRHKTCYIHPQNDALCIKFAHNKDGIKDGEKELRYYLLLNKKNITIDIIPSYYGTIQTNLGTGYIFDFIKNYDGSDILCLQDYLFSDELLKNNFDMLVEGLKQLKQTIFEKRLITSTIHPWNIVYKKESKDKGRFYIIDNIGSLANYPLEYYSNFIADIKVRRRWKRSIKCMNAEEKYDKPLVHKLMELVR